MGNLKLACRCDRADLSQWAQNKIRRIYAHNFVSVTQQPFQLVPKFRIIPSSQFSPEGKNRPRFRNSMADRNKTESYGHVQTCFPVAQPPKSGLDRLIVEVSRPHTIRHTRGMTNLNEWSASRRGCYIHNTQHTNIHALSGIRTHDTSNRVTADLNLRPRGPPGSSQKY